MDKIIEKFNKVHGSIYDYTNMIYVNNKSKIIIGCKKHGDFILRADTHNNGRGCPKCYIKKTLTREQVIEDFKNVHGEKYIYDEVVYTKSSNKVKIKCKEHGIFEQIPSLHKRGHGCKKCASIYSNPLLTREQVIEDFKNIHGEKYIYDEVVYTKSSNKVKIICLKHGIFEQIVGNHKQGQGCPRCRIYHSYYRDREFYNGKRTILYHIYLPDYKLYKVGLTIDSIEKRFKYDKIEYIIISEKIFEDGSLAFDKEQEILNNSIEYIYTGNKILVSGNTELRTIKLK